MNNINEYDIVVFTETKVSRIYQAYFSGFHTYINNSRNSNSGGVVILVKNNMEVSCINLNSPPHGDFDIVGVTVKNLSENFNLFAIYRRPGGVTSRGVWSWLLGQRINNYKSIYMGDFNAHNVAWNCADTDANGDILEDVSTMNGLICFNHDTLSRVGMVGQRSNNLDLVFGPNTWIDDVECTQMSDTWGSDHFPIRIIIGSTWSRYTRRTNRISTAKTMWEEYSHAVLSSMEGRITPSSEKLDDLVSRDYVENRYCLITDIIGEAIKKVTPNYVDRKNNEIADRTRTSGHTAQPKKWWDDVCDGAIRDRRRALRIFVGSGRESDYIEFKRLRAIARKVINRKKRESFYQYCASINKFSSLKHVWNTMRTYKNPSKRVHWNSWTTDREEVIYCSIDGLAPPMALGPPRTFFGSEKVFPELNDLFSMDELDRALRMIKRNSSPGLDGVEYRMIKLLPKNMLKEVLAFFNDVWISGIIPEEWRRNQVLFIDKPGQNKVRPISLSSCIGKVMERLVNERLIWWAEHTQQFDENQNGFRRGKSCLDNLVSMSIDINTAIYSGGYGLAAFIDVASAYDNVNIDILISRLILMKCPHKVVRFIYSWSRERIAHFVINLELQVTRGVRKGLPQGAVLSPSLYSLYTQGITAGLPHGVFALQFADDIALYCIGKDRLLNRRIIEEAVVGLSGKLGRLGLDLAPSKTVLVEFNRRGDVDKNIYINVNNTRIENTSEAKFLGIWFDNRLTFHRQVKEMRVKVNKANNIMKYLNRKTQGMEVNTALMLYKSLVRSVVDYGCFIYFPRNKGMKVVFERAQYLGLRTALGYRNSTPNNVCVAESKVMYLEDRAGFLARCFLIRNLSYGGGRLFDKIVAFSRFEDMQRFKNPLYQKSVLSDAVDRVKWLRPKIMERDKCMAFTEHYADVTGKLELDMVTGRSHVPKEGDLVVYRIGDVNGLSLENTSVVFTDGSRSVSGIAVGAGIVFMHSEIAYNISLPRECSSFTAEAFAIRSALKIVLREPETHRENILILTDSLSVLQALDNNCISVRCMDYVMDIRILYWRLVTLRRGRVVLAWIPAHRGILGNEVADQLAREATKEPHSEEIFVPVQDFSSLFRRELFNHSQLRAAEQAHLTGLHYFKNFFDNTRSKPWFNKMNNERYFVTWINRIRANHFNLRESLHRKGYVEDARCDCGNERESFDHFLWQCSMYDQERFKMEEEFVRRGLAYPVNVIEAIKRRDWMSLWCIFRFIKSTNRII